MPIVDKRSLRTHSDKCGMLCNLYHLYYASVICLSEAYCPASHCDLISSIPVPSSRPFLYRAPRPPPLCLQPIPMAQLMSSLLLQMVWFCLYPYYSLYPYYGEPSSSQFITEASHKLIKHINVNRVLALVCYYYVSY